MKQRYTSGTVLAAMFMMVGCRDDLCSAYRGMPVYTGVSLA